MDFNIFMLEKLFKNLETHLLLTLAQKFHVFNQIKFKVLVTLKNFAEK